MPPLDPTTLGVVPERSSTDIPHWYDAGMSKQITVRLSDDVAVFIDNLVDGGSVSSRAAALDKVVRREMRRVRAMEDALIYARTGEDAELAGFTQAAAASLRSMDLDQ